MGWIKRNLFFVIGGVIALALLGGSGFYIFQGWSKNSTTSDQLNEDYNTLKDLSGTTGNKIGPGNDKVNNTETAKEQEKQIHDWVVTARAYFQPIPVILASPVTDQSFASVLRRTVAQLQDEADAKNIAMPPKYDFSFTAQLSTMQFDESSLEPLAIQLSEIKAITEIIFSANVNALDSIQRVQVSSDDVKGPQADYFDEHSVTNDIAVTTPYVVTFRSFTPELARVISAFATSSNAFVIKAINVQPAGPAMIMNGQPGMSPEPFAGNRGFPGGFPGGYPGGFQPGVPPPVAQPVMNKGGLQTVLKEQLLKVTLEVEIVKLLPKS